MSRKKIYSAKLRLEVIKRYQKGESLETNTQKDITNENNIQK